MRSVQNGWIASQTTDCCANRSRVKEIDVMKKVLKYVITFAFGAAICVAVLFAREFFSQTETSVIYGDLCDAFFVPGILLCGFGLLVFASNGGAFDMLAFGVIKLADLFRRDLTKVRYRTFYDYRKAQSEKKHSYGFLLIAGLFFLVASVAFLALFESTQ